MDDDEKTIKVLLAIVVFLFGLLTGILVGFELSHNEELGQMICDKKASDKPYTLEYDMYEPDTETVVCKKQNVERFDGGHVRITG